MILSVIIPAYNCEKYIEECVSSVINQNIDEMEVIIVDDGSTDSTLDILLRLEKENQNVRVFTKENEGANSARKKGVLESKGELLFFLDSDDYIKPNMLYEMLEVQQRYDVDIVTSRVAKIFKDGSIYEAGITYEDGIYQGKYLAENICDINKFFNSKISLGLVSHIFKRFLIENDLIEIDKDIFFSEDRISWLAFFKAKKVYVYNKSNYMYRVNEASVTRTHKKSNFNNVKLLNHFIIKKLKLVQASQKMYEIQKQFVIRDLLLGGYEEGYGWLDFLFPFKDVAIGSEIIIYGAGVFGQEIIKYIENTEKYKIKAWVDKKSSVKDVFYNHSVDNTSVLDNAKYDYIIIAVTIYRVYMEIYEELINKGVPKEKIKIIDRKLIDLKYVNPIFFSE